MPRLDECRASILDRLLDRYGPLPLPVDGPVERLAAQAGKFERAGRIKALLERHALFEKIHGFARFTEMHFGGGEKIQDGAAIDKSGTKVLYRIDLRANLRSVVGFGRSASNLLFFCWLRLVLLLLCLQTCRRGNQHERNAQPRKED